VPPGLPASIIILEESGSVCNDKHVSLLRYIINFRFEIIIMDRKYTEVDRTKIILNEI